MSEKTPIEKQIKNLNQRIGTLEAKNGRARSEVSNNFLDSLIGKPIIFFRMKNTEPCDGVLLSYDEYTLIIRCGEKQVLYYKHSIESIFEV